METVNELSIGLFDPGMTHLHRVGLAGLYMTLKEMEKSNQPIDDLSWTLTKDRITLFWNGKGREAFKNLLNRSFGITKRPPGGLIDLAGHRSLAIGETQRVLLHDSILRSFLQHNKQHNIPKGTDLRSIVISLDKKQVVLQYKPFILPYQHSMGADPLFNKKGELNSRLTIKGWLYPGSAVRHEVHKKRTKIEESPPLYICLLFAPVASLYFRLLHRGPDGKYDKRRSTAICLPHLVDLEIYAESYGAYLESPVERLSADSLGDAALSALTLFRVRESLSDLGVVGCTVITMGEVGWSKQQQTRTGVLNLENVEEMDFNSFEIALRCLSNRIKIYQPQATKKDPNPGNRFFVATSLTRGLIANNIVEGREWFKGFWRLMKSKAQAALIGFERKGLKEMVEKATWNNESDKLLVEAVHIAIRTRYGALAGRAKEKGERIPFDREYERIRTGLMRAKNAQTLREELADLFARGGVNKILQENWRSILPLFTGDHWQRARDLALLGLASYSGKGAEEIEIDGDKLDEEGME